MGTTHSALPSQTTETKGRSPDRPLLIAALLSLLLLAAGCTSVRPVVKIGLIAPFEGLYRASGYSALDALRRGIADCAAPGVDVLPLALDDSADPALARRAAQKLLADPAVVAVIGPLPLAAVAPVADVMAAVDLPWIVPSLVTPDGGFAAPSSSAWVVSMAEAIALSGAKPSIAADAPKRVLIIGLPAPLALDLPPAVAQTPLLRLDDPDAATLLPGDAVLWLAAPDAGAAWRAAHPDISLWLGAQYGGDIWAQRVAETARSHWLIWTDNEYNSEPQPLAPADPPAYLIYRATCAIMAQLGSTDPSRSGPWQLATQSFSVAP